MAFAELGETDRAWELFALLKPIRHAMNAADVNIRLVDDRQAHIVEVKVR